MFGKLKDKLKLWIGKVSEENETFTETKRPLEKIKETSKKKEKVKPIEEHIYVQPEKKIFDEEERKVGDRISEDINEEKKHFFKSIFSSKKIISSEEFEKYSEELEMILLENNVALEVAEKIISELKEKIVGKELDKKDLENLIKKSLEEIIKEVLVKPFDLVREIEEKKSPYVILFCGTNGAGKTTSIAKFANLLKTKKITSVLGAGDPFRAASIEQLKKHGENLDVKVISHDYGSDPASVGFDTIKYAEKNKNSTKISFLKLFKKPLLKKERHFTQPIAKNICKTGSITTALLAAYPGPVVSAAGMGATNSHTKNGKK